jgi:hypothetical protein
MTPKAALLALAFALAAAQPALAASITIVTVTIPKDAQDFTYDFSGVPYILDDDAGAVGGDNARSNTATRENMAAGFKDITERQTPPGWALTSITCKGASGETVRLHVRRVDVGLNMHTKAVCTFVHQKVAP